MKSLDVKKFFILALVLRVSVGLAFSQTKVSVSTNFVDYIEGGTLNIDASVSMSRHWTIGSMMRYNPYSDTQKQRTILVGVKYWPWYVYSGWWLSSGAKYQEFSDRGEYLKEGDRLGAMLWAGHSWMLNKHFNIDLGWGIWGGYETYLEYGCETCARIRSKGDAYFVRPDQFMLSVSYIF